MDSQQIVKPTPEKKAWFLTFSTEIKLLIEIPLKALLIAFCKRRLLTTIVVFSSQCADLLLHPNRRRAQNAVHPTSIGTVVSAETVVSVFLLLQFVQLRAQLETTVKVSIIHSANRSL